MSEERTMASKPAAGKPVAKLESKGASGAKPASKPAAKIPATARSGTKARPK